MTKSQLRSLSFFHDGERTLGGKPIDWSVAHYETFYWLERLRQRLDSPVHIIRETHPGKPTAVDWCCPNRKYSDIVMEVLRVPKCSYGFYSGNSVHLDMRGFRDLPARWLAIKPDERGHLYTRSLSPLLVEPRTPTTEWLYLLWDWDALKLVVDLAEQNAKG